jgi:hypothetical protein
MSTQVYVGLALSATNDGVINQSTFDYVRTTQATPSGYVAIAAGGGAIGTFQADQDVSGGSTAQFSAPIDLSGVTDPAPMGVYQTERHGTFTYTIPNLTAGRLYTVRLHFAEDFWSSAGQRIFDVSINGTQVLTDFDIFATTGSMFTAIVEQFAARADANGQIAIDFSPSASSPDQNAKVDGIEVIPVMSGSRILTQQTGSIAVVQGQPFTGILGTFVDTDPGGLARDYLATINWGDGVVTNGAVEPDPSGSGFDVLGTHTYAGHGNFNLSTIIQSYDGAGAELGNQAVVAAALVSIGLPTSYTATAGASTGPIVLSTFTDASAGAKASNYTASIDWGDGSAGSANVITAPGGFFVVASHTYPASGSYVPLVSIAALDGAALTTNNTTIVANGAAAAPAPAIALGAGPGGPAPVAGSGPPSDPVTKRATAQAPHHPIRIVSRHEAKTKAAHAAKWKLHHRSAPKLKVTVSVAREKLARSDSVDLDELARDLLS